MTRRRSTRQNRKDRKRAVRAATTLGLAKTLATWTAGNARLKAERERMQLAQEQARLTWQQKIREDGRKQEAHDAKMAEAALRHQKLKAEIAAMKRASDPKGVPMKACPQCNTHYPLHQQTCDYDGQELIETRVIL